MEDEFQNVKNRIWITERCHMKAEKRSRFLDLYFHIVLASFALASIGISVLNNTSIGPLKEDMLTFTSITTLCLSLLIFGFKFGETAANHRSCYLALQKLRATKHDDHLSLERDYIEILGHYPNHTHGDYMRLAVSNILRAMQDLESPPGKKVTFDRWDRLVYFSGWILARFSLIVFALMPLVMALYGADFLSLSLTSP
jgi:hypothetical protein